MTKISTSIYSRANKYLVSIFHVPDTGLVKKASSPLSPKFRIWGLRNKDHGRQWVSDLRIEMLTVSLPQPYSTVSMSEHPTKHMLSLPSFLA